MTTHVISLNKEIHLVTSKCLKFLVSGGNNNFFPIISPSRNTHGPHTTESDFN